MGDPGSIPGLRTSPGEGNGYPLQYSHLENFMDREAYCRLQSMGHKESDMTEQLINIHRRYSSSKYSSDSDNVNIRPTKRQKKLSV